MTLFTGASQFTVNDGKFNDVVRDQDIYADENPRSGSIKDTPVSEAPALIQHHLDQSRSPAVVPAVHAPISTGTYSGASGKPVNERRQDDPLPPVPPANHETEEDEGAALADQGIAISNLILAQLRTVAVAASIPFLSPAAAASLSILGNVKATRGNKGDFEQIAEDSCKLVYVVIDLYEGQRNQGKEVPKDLDAGLKGLLETLGQIQAFTMKMARRRGWIGVIKRFLFPSIDAGKVQNYRRKLVQALNIFWLQSDIQIRAQVADLAEKSRWGPIQSELRASVETNQTSGDFSFPPDILSKFSVDLSSSSFCLLG